MGGFFDRFFGRSSSSKKSAQDAKQRLQFVLVHDRINLSPEALKAMKEEILAVISKYVHVNTDEVDIALEQIDRKGMLKAEVPFTGTFDDNAPTIEDEDFESEELEALEIEFSTRKPKRKLEYIDENDDLAGDSDRGEEFNTNALYLDLKGYDSDQIATDDEGENKD